MKKITVDTMDDKSAKNSITVEKKNRNRLHFHSVYRFLFLFYILFIHIGQFCALIRCDQTVNYFIQVSIQNRIQFMKCQLDPVICHTSLREVVSSDLLRTISCSNLASSRLSFCGLLFFQFQLIQFGTEQTECFFFILQL